MMNLAVIVCSCIVVVFVATALPTLALDKATLLPIPAEKPGMVQYQTYAKSPARPHLKIKGVKLYRDWKHHGDIGIVVAVNNIGKVTCKRCWLSLILQVNPGGEYWFWGKILVVPSSEPLRPGETRRRHWYIRETNRNFSGWKLEFDSYAAPSDP